MAAPDGRATATEVHARLEVVRELMARRGARRALLRTRRNFAWLTVGGDGHVVLSTDTVVAPIAIDARTARVLAPVNEADRLAEEELARAALRDRTIPLGGRDIPRSRWRPADAGRRRRGGGSFARACLPRRPRAGTHDMAR